VRDDFGVGLGFESVAFAGQPLLQAEVILDNAVVHHDDVAGAVAMRVRVFFRRAAMGCPAGVADAEIAVDGVDADSFFEVAEFSRSASHSKTLVVTIDGKASGVVAAVLEPFQTFQDNRDSLAVPNIPDDSAHRSILGVHADGRLNRPLTYNGGGAPGTGKSGTAAVFLEKEAGVYSVV